MAEDEIQHSSMKEIKVGRFVLIDGVPCKIVNIDTSAPGKHGSAKMRVTGIGIFDGQKKVLLKPSSGDVDVPVINKRKAQVVSVSETSAQLMDSETFEVYDMQVPEEMRGKLVAGAEVEVMEAMGRKALMRV
jgi:translation initiation factor 5A